MVTLFAKTPVPGASVGCMGNGFKRQGLPAASLPPGVLAEHVIGLAL
jgi:hypothetical protein